MGHSCQSGLRVLPRLCPALPLLRAYSSLHSHDVTTLLPRHLLKEPRAGEPVARALLPALVGSIGAPETSVLARMENATPAGVRALGGYGESDVGGSWEGARSWRIGEEPPSAPALGLQRVGLQIKCMGFCNFLTRPPSSLCRTLLTRQKAVGIQKQKN